MDGPGFHVDVDVLERAASGVRESVAAQNGSPLRDAAGSADAYGHAGLGAAVHEFCARWGTGVDLLVEDAGRIGDGLAHVAAAYRSADAGAASSLGGDPAVQAAGDG
jgi:hypothetical protein